MIDKPFKTYEELVVKLRDEKKLTVPDEKEVIALLKKHSYFALVSGYKVLFKKSNGEYKDGATINDILALFEFDNRLRDIFFHSIQIIEKHIKSLLTYSFVAKYGESQNAYLCSTNYDVFCQNPAETALKSKEVQKLINVFGEIVTPPFQHAYIEHQWKKHNNIPLWAAIKAVTIGNTSKMYSLCTKDVQASVSKEFPVVTEKQLAGMLDYLTRVRNVCAHNERLYDFDSGKKRAIQAMPIHKELKIKKDKSYYKKGQTDLFAAMICLKYLLSPDEYLYVANAINKEINELCKRTKLIPKAKILSCMGFPENWYDSVNL